MSFARKMWVGGWFALIFVCWSAGPALSAGKTHRVCADCEFHGLRAAVAAADAGDTILVHAGVYREGLVEVFKPLTILGVDRPTIDGRGDKHVFYVRADDVTLRGLVIQGSGSSFVSDFAGIRAEHSRRCLFADNLIRDNTYSIYFEKVSNCVVRNNTIVGNAVREVTAGNGVHLFYSDHIRVVGNDVSKSRDGLYFEFTEDSMIADNRSHDNLRFGMHFMFSHRNEFSRNSFTGNPTGVAIMYSRNLTVRRNSFEKSRGASSYGILIKEITDSNFTENLFRENTLGIMLNGSNRNLIQRNGFLSNGRAAEIYTNSYDNEFRQNNFVENKFDIATNSRRNTNRFEFNYWDRYRGYDLDRDGRGDVPFRPVSVFSFWVGRYPELGILLNSPVVTFLEIAERVFPAITPESLADPTPRMKAFPAPEGRIGAGRAGGRDVDG